MSSPSPRTFLRSVVASWRAQSSAVRVIRLWLGLTWVYGGWNKATDPGFLSKTGSTYIGRQLTGYASNSPFGFFFRHLIERATFVGVTVTILEFAIGIATLFWIAPTFTAFVGFSMSVGLWIAATWHVKPYFLGSDTAYAVLWLSYFLTLLGKRRKVDVCLDRRGAMRIGALGITSVAAMLVGRYVFKPASPGRTALSTTGGTPAPNQIIKLADLAVGATHEFASADGQPAILFRTKNGVFAYSEICTHQGCTVSYSAPDKVLVCPCHSGVYDPFNGAAVVAGPPQSPLPPVKVAISGEWVVQA
jgi:thiosulfate dehydrogenase [quinone] large subunit